MNKLLLALSSFVLLGLCSCRINTGISALVYKGEDGLEIIQHEVSFEDEHIDVTFINHGERSFYVENDTSGNSRFIFEVRPGQIWNTKWYQNRIPGLWKYIDIYGNRVGFSKIFRIGWLDKTGTFQSYEQQRQVILVTECINR